MDFPALLQNHQLWLEFPHVIFATFMAGAFVVMGVSAFSLLRKPHHEVNFFKKSVQVSAVVALVGVVGLAYTGDSHSLALQEDQPMKFAATEGLDKNVGGDDEQAPWSVISYTDPKTNEVKWSLDVPYMLSILAHHSLTGGSQGWHELNKELHEKYDVKFGHDMNYYLPNNTLYYSFRIMAASAGAFGLLAVVALWFTRKKSKIDITKYKWALWIFGIATYLPFVAITSGWLITELGRAPWVVYGVLTMADAVSPNVSAASLLTSNILYFSTFTVLGLIMVMLSRRVMIAGPESVDETETEEDVDPFSPKAFENGKEA